MWRPRIPYKYKYKYYKGDWEWRGIAIVNSGKTFRMTKEWDKCLMAWNDCKNPEKYMNDNDWYDIRREEKDRWTWDDGHGSGKISEILSYHSAYAWSVWRFINERMPWGSLFNEPWSLKAEQDLRDWKKKYLYVW